VYFANVLQVGWFLHTPFPSSEIYRTLPVREEVLRATLRADLIGFHTYDYARHFISSCTRILGLEGTPEGVEDNGRCGSVCSSCVVLVRSMCSSSLWQLVLLV
jgi:trehalose 6-phosphate synthase/phosphatase